MCSRWEKGRNSEEIGCGNRARGDCSLATGQCTTVVGRASFTSGKCNKVIGDYSLASGYKNKVTASSSIASGEQNLVSGSDSIVIGVQNNTNGQGNIITGSGNTITGNNCQSFGLNNTSTGYQNASLGALTYSHGAESIASGYDVSTGTDRAGVLIHGHNAKAYKKYIIPGQYNYLLDSDNYSFQLGGGSFDQAYNPADPSTPDGLGISLALRTQAMGPAPIGEVVATQHRSDFTGFAELYEFAVVQVNPFGYFYTVDEFGFLTLALDDSNVIGVASHCPAFVADCGDLPASQGWVRDNLLSPTFKNDTTAETIRLGLSKLPSDIIAQGFVLFDVYLNCTAAGGTDCYDQFISNLSQLPTSDPEGLQLVVDAITASQLLVLDYSPPVNFNPRSSDPKWVPIVYLGKVAVYDNGVALPGSLVSISNGIAIPGSKYRVLRRISPNTILILLK